MNRSSPRLAAIALAAIVLTNFEARAGFLPVDLNPYTNQNIRQSPYQTVASLPLGGTTITVGTTPFKLATYNGQAGTTGVVQVGPFTPGATTPSSIDIAVSIAGAVEVDTLINSTYGSLNRLSGQVQFFGTGGAFASFVLVQGVNIRDYNVGSVFNNTIASGTNTAVFTGTTPTAGGTTATRLDEQVFLLPTAFAGQTLTTIRLVSSSTSLFDGAPFMAGVSVNVVPEPASIVMLGIATAVGIGLHASRKPRPGPRTEDTHQRT